VAPPARYSRAPAAKSATEVLLAEPWNLGGDVCESRLHMLRSELLVSTTVTMQYGGYWSPTVEQG